MSKKPNKSMDRDRKKAARRAKASRPKNRRVSKAPRRAKAPRPRNRRVSKAVPRKKKSAGTAVDLKAQNQTLTAIFLNAPYTMMLLDREGRVRAINRPGRDFAQKSSDEPVHGKFCGDLVTCVNAEEGKGCGNNDPCPDCPVRSNMRRVFETGEAVCNIEGRMTVRRRGGPVDVDVLVSAGPARVGGEDLVLVTLIDQTERKKADEALRHSQARLKAIFDQAGAGIVLIDGNGRFLDCNARWEQITGYPVAQLMRMTNLQVTHQDDAETSRQGVDALMNGGADSFQIEKRIVRADGRETWVDLAMTPIRDSQGGVMALLGVAADITGRKQIEEQLRQDLTKRQALEAERLNYQQRLQALASELSRAEDQHRRHFAAILHDGIGQDLFGIKMRLAALRTRSKDSMIIAEVDDIMGILGKSIADARSLTLELCPPALYEVGLGAALERLVQQFSSKHGIPCRLEAASPAEPADLDLRSFLYHAARELLVNVARHASATNAVVRFWKDSGGAALAVEDDGVGMKPDQGASGTGFGLFSIRERLAGFGGELMISPLSPRGLRVAMIFPVKS